MNKDFEMTIFEEIENNNIEIIKQYIKDGKDLNIQNNDGFTPLNKSTIWNRIEITKLLLDNNADPNIQNLFGFTSLHYAISWNNIKIAKLLLDNGADPNIQNNESKTPLDIDKTCVIKLWIYEKKLKILQKRLDKS